MGAYRFNDEGVFPFLKRGFSQLDLAGVGDSFSLEIVTGFSNVFSIESEGVYAVVDSFGRRKIEVVVACFWDGEFDGK
jgi:hypothetical protein